MRKLMTLILTERYSAHQLKNEMGWLCDTVMGEEGVLWGNLREREDLVDKGVNGRIILE
jgi:hypothetical protein